MLNPTKNIITKFTFSQFALAILVLIFLAIIFYLVTPDLKSSVGVRFDSPDETANYFWIQQFAQDNQLKITEPLNLVAKNQIHPRSFNVTDDGALVPGTFLGLIIFYGLLAKFLGSWVIIYLTPILALLGIFSFYGIIKKIFDEKIALISAVLLFIHPVWFYYSVTTMYSNITFVSLILISLYFFISFADQIRRDLLKSIIAGLSLGLALAIRPSEALLILVLFAVIFYFKFNKKTLSSIIVMLIFSALVFLPILFLQKYLYGSFLATGYTQLQASASCQLCQTINGLILPFGFHPRLALHNFWSFYLYPFWWLAIFAIFGLLIFLVGYKKARPAPLIYLLTSGLVGILLVSYYGSLIYSDQAIKNLDRIGISYVRYWLPLYLLAVPFIAFGVNWLGDKLGRRFKPYLITIILILFLFLASNIALSSGPDSILPMKQRIKEYQNLSSTINSITPNNSVVIAVRQDKVFFPDRRVINLFDSLATNQEILSLLPALSKKVEVYYYSPQAEKNLQLTNEVKIELVKVLSSGVLYQIK